MPQEALHAAAASGSLELCRKLLDEGTPRPAVNAPDSAGRSAIFYAQLQGHTAVVNLLAFYGWTRMPSGNLHRGPGGRLMFWQGGGEWGASVPHMTDQAPPSTTRDERLTTRDERRAPRPRRAVDRPTQNVVGKDHRLFARKQASAPGSSCRRSKLPSLNTRDFAECHDLNDQLVLEETHAFIFSTYQDTRALIEAQAYDEERATSGDGRDRLEWTVGHVARFIVDRKPTQRADGSWVVVESGDSSSAEPAYCIPLREAQEKASLAAVTEAVGAAWPPLPAPTPPHSLLAVPDGWQWVNVSVAHCSEAASLVDCESLISLEDDEPEAVSMADSVSIISLADSDIGDVLALEGARPWNGDHDNDGVTSDGEALQPGGGVEGSVPTAAGPGTGAWRGAAATRAAVCFQDEPRAFKARKATTAQSLPRDEEKASRRAQCVSDEDEGIGWLDCAAGKDASHRVRGSHGLSAKAVEKRQEAKEKRAYARSVTVGGAARRS